MKRLLILPLLCISLLALHGFTVGCATLSNIFNATTQPTTPAAQIDAIQRDLDTAKAGANLAHELGKWQKPAEWSQIQSGFATAQLILTASREKVTTGGLDQQTITDLINAAAQAVHDAKAQAK